MSDADKLDLAWGIIANASGGDWSKESPEWREAAEKWRDAYTATSSAEAQPLNSAEAVFGLLAWLTTRDEVTTLSARHGSDVAADIAKRFCDVNKLGNVSSAWPRNLTHPPVQP